MEWLEHRLTLSAVPISLVASNLEDAPPTVELLQDELVEGQTTISLRFSEPVVGADMPANFQLLAAGSDGVVNTNDDSALPLSATYSAQTTTLTFAAITSGEYRLIVSSSIADADGRSLDGDNDGTDGGAFIAAVSVIPAGPLLSVYPSPSLDNKLIYAAALNSHLLAIRYAGGDGNGIRLIDLESEILVADIPDLSPGFESATTYRIALSGTHLAVGFPLDDADGSNVGRVFVYELSGNLLHSLQHPTLEAGSLFGLSIAIDENKVFVGSPNTDAVAPDSGAVFTFDVVSGRHLDTIADPLGLPSDKFGTSIAVDGDRLLVGAPGAVDAGREDSGRAYVLNASSGAFLGELPNPSPRSGLAFGNIVIAGGGRAAVGRTSIDRPGLHVYDTATQSQLYHVPGSPTTAILTDGFLAVGYASIVNSDGSRGKVSVYDAATGANVREFKSDLGYGNEFGQGPDAFGFIVGLYRQQVIVGGRTADSHFGGRQHGIERYALTAKIEVGQ